MADERAHDGPAPGGEGGGREVYRGRILTLRLEEVRGPDGSARTREIVEHGGGAAAVAVDDQHRVLLVRQHRPAVGEQVLEIPAGMLDQGEDPAACAAREVEEETGTRPGQMDLLARFYVSPGYTTEMLHVYLATNLQTGAANLDEGEEVEVVWMPLAEAETAIARGEIRDAKTIVGILAYLRRAQRGDS